MTDRELQVLAAKATGIDHPGGHHSIHDDGRLWDCGSLRWWNPLADDGDALRLAVKLRIDLSLWINKSTVTARTHIGGRGISLVGESPFIEDFHREEYGADPFAATRRAIVRAAAEIGKAMP